MLHIKTLCIHPILRFHTTVTNLTERPHVFRQGIQKCLNDQQEQEIQSQCPAICDWSVHEARSLTENSPTAHIVFSTVCLGT